MINTRMARHTLTLCLCTAHTCTRNRYEVGTLISIFTCWEPPWPGGKKNVRLVSRRTSRGLIPLWLSSLFKSCDLWTPSRECVHHNERNIKMAIIAAHLNAVPRHSGDESVALGIYIIYILALPPSHGISFFLIDFS